MTANEYKLAAYHLVYLIRCALNDKKPSKAMLDKMNISNVYTVSEAHFVSAIAAYALESAGVSYERFRQAKLDSIRRDILFNIERENICAQLEANKIWYVPLKGIIIKNFYPRTGMRQMSDNDILFDESKRKQVHDIFISNGYETDMYEVTNQDVYKKEPVFNFEMHVCLAGKNDFRPVRKYYKDIAGKLVSDGGFRKRMTDEDFYIYVIAHAYKHYASRGTGLRTLVDIYVLSDFYEKLDKDYIKTELKKMNIYEYEKQSRLLAEKIFTGRAVSKEEREMLNNYIFSSAYGTQEHLIENNMIHYNNSIIKYYFSRVFKPMLFLKTEYPFLKDHKILIPFVAVYKFFERFFNATVRNRSDFIEEMKTVIKLKK